MNPLLIVLGVIFLIGCIPVSVCFRYHDGVDLRLKIACFCLRLLPKKALMPGQQEKAERKKEKKAAEKAEKEKKKRAKALLAPPKPEGEASEPSKAMTEKLSELLAWARLGVQLVGEFCSRKLTVTRLRICVALAGGDPAKTALTVGRAWQTIGIALPTLERAFRIRERKIAVYPDFQAQKTELEAELCVRLRAGGVLLLALKYVFKALLLYIRQKRGANKQEEKQASPVQNNEKEKAG